MSCPFAHDKSGPSRRGVLTGAGGLLAGASVARLARAATQGAPVVADPSEAFFGVHQGGIATPQQRQSYFAVFDLTAKSRDEVIAMLSAWTDAAARMTAGQPARPMGDDVSVEASDGGSTLGLKPAGLTITFGFGAGLFIKGGVDRYGLAAKRPEALVDLPKFNGDQLQPARTGGDISVQACADDPMVAFHAVRELDRLSYGGAQFRWAQAGFLPQTPPGETPRNLMGFKDGTNNPAPVAPPRRLMRPEVLTTSSGSPKKVQTGCAAAAMSWRAESGFRSNIGIEPKSTFRNRSSAGINIPGADRQVPRGRTSRP